MAEPPQGASINASKYPKGGYLEKSNMPKDPWKYDYIYMSPGYSGKEYDLISYGRDGEPGGEGFDKDIICWEIE
ncbi:type II secretion system protein GspG [Desulfonema magnum]|uniref:type II secretion system protein GspG n=1 Tax=Desulfonema magnum TaxID=45655 RepID=UPI001FEB508F|nr:type II secretion system protein GspG [Desulfonema magnum]